MDDQTSYSRGRRSNEEGELPGGATHKQTHPAGLQRAPVHSHRNQWLLESLQKGMWGDSAGQEGALETEGHFRDRKQSSAGTGGNLAGLCLNWGVVIVCIRLSQVIYLHILKGINFIVRKSYLCESSFLKKKILA